jgi:hypothetical protein
MRTVIIYDPDKPVIIRNFPNDYEAELGRTLVEAAGIPCMFVRIGEGFAVGPVQLAVRQKDVEAALEALDAPSEA